MAAMSDTPIVFASRREEILDHLRDGPFYKPELTEHVSVSRSTVDRAISNLHEHGLIRRSSGGYETTVTGVIALHRCRRHQREARALAKTADHLEPLGKEVPLDAAMLIDATCYSVESSDHLEATRILRSHLRKSKRITAVLPDIVDTEQLQMLRSRAVEAEVLIEIVFGDGLYTTLQEDHPGWLRTIALEGNAAIYSTELPQFGVYQYQFDGQSACILTVFNDGKPHAVLYNDTDEAVEWAEEYTASIRQQSTERQEDIEQLPDRHGETNVSLSDIQPSTTNCALARGEHKTTDNPDLLGGGYTVVDSHMRTPSFGAKETASVAFWMYPKGFDNEWQVLVKWSSMVIAYRRGELFGNIYDRFEGRRYGYVPIDGDEIVPRQWCHLAYVFGKDTASLYLDGERVDEAEHAYDLILQPLGATIGNHYRFRDTGVHNPQYHGAIRDARFYDRELASEDVHEIYESTEFEEKHL